MLGKAIGVVEHITVNDTYDVGGVLAGKGNGNVAARLSESPCVGQLLADIQSGRNGVGASPLVGSTTSSVVVKVTSCAVDSLPLLSLATTLSV